MNTEDAHLLPTRSSTFKNVESAEDEQLYRHAELNYMQKYLLELNRYYGSIAYIFGDVNGGDRVCIKWKPAKPLFRVNMSTNLKLVRFRLNLRRMANSKLISVAS
jgi:hypothetical protein